jgi:hypothetical protein
MCSCSNLGAASRLMCDNCKASGHTDYFRHFCSFLVEKEGHGDTGHPCPSDWDRYLWASGSWSSRDGAKTGDWRSLHVRLQPSQRQNATGQSW